MAIDKNYEFIEITRNFPLTADNFKVGNATDEEVKKIKQHKRIEQAITTFYPHAKEIEKNLTKDDIKLVKFYRECGFCVGEVALLCREIALQTALERYIFKNNGSLDHVSAEIMGLAYKEKEIFDTPQEVREVIRLDACGMFIDPTLSSNKHTVDMNRKIKALDSRYIYEIDSDEKFDIVGGYVSTEKRNIKGPDGKKHKETFEKIYGGKKQVKSDIPSYKIEEYDLNTSPTWKNVFSKFENFNSIESNIINTLHDLRFNPEVIQYMGLYEFKDIISKTFNKDNDAITMFTGSINKKVAHCMSEQKNTEAIEKYLRLHNKKEKDISLRMNLLKTRGFLFSKLSAHHIVHVSNAGETINYNRINDFDNIVIVSDFMHKLFHSMDHIGGKNDDKIIGLFPEKEKHDLILSITPIFRTSYTPQKTKALVLSSSLSKIGGKSWQKV